MPESFFPFSYFPFSWIDAERWYNSTLRAVSKLDDNLWVFLFLQGLITHGGIWEIANPTVPQGSYVSFRQHSMERS